jgi:hypothetical protein
MVKRKGKRMLVSGSGPFFLQLRESRVLALPERNVKEDLRFFCVSKYTFHNIQKKKKFDLPRYGDDRHDDGNVQEDE